MLTGLTKPDEGTASVVGLGLAVPQVALVIALLVLSCLAFAGLGSLVSVSVREVCEAQTLANFFRFPMIFLCGVFLPVASLPGVLQPVAYALPLTYAVDGLRGALLGAGTMPGVVDLAVLAVFAVG
ncbi:MAG: ABC transporter permease, partial [Dehalococcoidales bacterium]|nr:ABC transporter permease [Dehalococcoidales bacterium]